VCVCAYVCEECVPAQLESVAHFRMWAYLYVYTYAFGVFVFEHIRVCAYCEHVYTHICAYKCIFIHAFMYLCVHVCMCGYSRVIAFERECVYVSAYVYVHTYV